MKELKFFKCEICGNVVVKLVDKNVPVFCCGQAMTVLMPNTVDAAVEKHLPVVEMSDGVVSVKVGSVLHPMEEAHHISFVAVETDRNYVVATLSKTPEVKVFVGDAKVKAVYEYCSLHGLWKTGL